MGGRVSPICILESQIMSLSAASAAVKTAPPSPSSYNARPLAIALVLIVVGIAYVQATVGPKQAALAVSAPCLA